MAADRISINVAEKDRVVSDMNAQAEEMLSYINGELSNMVNNFSSWWEGDAYQSFLQDFNATKERFKKEIYDEIKTYSNNLNTAVNAQQQQDTSNASSIKIQ